MRTIGIRVSPKEVVFAIFDTSDRRVVNAESIKIPQALSVPERLKHVRNNILDVLREYVVESAGIRITEPTAKKLSVDRIQIEGVIQEAFASSDLKSYYVGQIASISSRVGIDRKNFKKYVEGQIDLDLVENWDDLKEMEREAVLCAIGASDA